MRTWPAKLAELYPLPPAPLHNGGDPLRPWWYLDLGARGWVRLPDRATIRLYQDTRDDRAKEALGLADDASLAEQRAQYDHKHPLPHPGRRVGQIWANEEGEAVFIDFSYVTNGVAAGRIYHPGEEPTSHLRHTAGNAHIERYPFLVHDTVCPWFAPWAPAGQP